MDEPTTGRVSTPRGGRTSAAGTSVEKAMRVLEALALAGKSHRLADLAAGAGISRSTAYRILPMFRADGFAESAGEGYYAAGSRLKGLAAELVSSVEASVDPLLRELKDGAGGNSVHLALRIGDRAVYVHKVDSDNPYELRSRVGDGIWLHCTAIGKAILGHMPWLDARSVVQSAGMPARTPATITNVENLRDELMRVRERGYAIDDEENEATVRCLGTAVLDRAGRPKGGVDVTTLAFATEREELLSYGPLVRATAKRLADLC